MTEAEWLEFDDPMPMVGIVRDKASDRKLRLLAVASCRRVMKLFEDVRSRQWVETAELHAEGQVDDEQLDATLIAASDAYNDATYQRGLSSETFVARCLLAQAIESVAQPPTDGGVRYRGWEALSMIGRAVAILRPHSVVERVPFPEGDMTFASGVVFTESLSLDEQMAQADLIRDIFGNPFRPVSVDPDWLTPAVVALATAANKERELPSGPLDRDRLAVFCDSLEEAGCDNAEMLTHLRGSGPHVRGCWVVDLLLGRK